MAPLGDIRSPSPKFIRIRPPRSQEYASVLVVFCFVTPIPVFSTSPLPRTRNFVWKNVFRGIGVTSVFFLSFFWIKVELIRQTSLQWFSVKLSEIFLHLVIDCRNFYDNRIPTFSQLRFSGRIDDVEIVIFQIVRLFFDYITHRDYRVESENNKLTFDI